MPLYGASLLLRDRIRMKPVSSPPTPLPILFASANNWIGRGVETVNASYDAFINTSKSPIWLHCDRIWLCTNNWYFLARNTTASNVGGITYKAKVACNGVVKIVTWSGADSIKPAVGANNVQSDPLLPSDFGIATGDFYGYVMVIEYRLIYETRGVTWAAPLNQRSIRVDDGGVGYWYDTALYDQTLNANGSVTENGSTAKLVRNNAIQPWVIGQSIQAGQVAWIGLGDSITQASGDVDFGPSDGTGRGWFSRAIKLSSVPGCNCGINGTNSLLGIAEDRFKAWLSYANRAVVFYGTNDLGVDGIATPLATIKTNMLNVYQMINDAGINTIVGAKVITRCSSTDSFATVANQTTNTGWTAGGYPWQFNDWLDSLVGDKLVSVCHFADLHAASDYYKWDATGVAQQVSYDGTHPAPLGHARMATELAAKMLAAA